MASLKWSAWSTITPTESQRLYKYFASHGSIVIYTSKKNYAGLIGRGTVVFADAKDAEKLLGDQEAKNVDLAHIFGPTASTIQTASSTTAPSSSESSQTENSATSASSSAADSNSPSKTWSIDLRRLDKTPLQSSVLAQVNRRNLSLKHERKIMDRYLAEHLQTHKHYSDALKRVVPKILDETMQIMKQVSTTAQVKSNRDEQQQTGAQQSGKQVADQSAQDADQPEEQEVEQSEGQDVEVSGDRDAGQSEAHKASAP